MGGKVDVHGLISRSDLNGLTGTFMGRTVTKKNEVRYKIQIMMQVNDGPMRKQIFLLKKENFRFRHVDENDSDEYDSDCPPPLVVTTDEDNNKRNNNNNNSSSNNTRKMGSPSSSKGKKENSEDKFLRIQKDLEAKDQDGFATRIMYKT